MLQSPAKLLDRFDNHPDACVYTSGEARILDVKRAGLVVRVTVPMDVLEWFVDVHDGDTVVAHDWWDYEGYDDKPTEKLAGYMTRDIKEFVVKLLDRDIRLVDRGPGIIEGAASKLLKRDVKLFATKRNLEWLVEGSWEQALPFA